MTRRTLLALSAAIVLLCATSGCKYYKTIKAKITGNKALYTSEAYSDCVIDSNFVRRELAADKSLKPYAEDILEFYRHRGYEAAWLNEGTLTVSAYDFLATLRGYESDFGDTTVTQGLDDADIGTMLFTGTSDERALLDLKLTATFFRYAQRAYSGTTEDIRDLEWYIPRMKKDYQRLIDSLVSSPATYTVYEPVNSYYKALKKVLVQYRALEKKGGIPAVEVARLPLRSGDSTAAVSQLKAALALTGDYTDSDRGELFSDTLVHAVRHYQQRVGLRPTGRVDSATLAEINTPIAARIRQIMLNMERLRWMPDSLPPDYLLVNIPEYRLHVHEHDSIVWSMDVVVGNAATATSIFTGRLSVVEFSPYWNVPQSIIRNELLPKLKNNPGYLRKANMELVGSSGRIIDPATINWNKYSKGVPFTIRQRPGNDCALGLVAFFFPNSFDIFLHDTPAKSYFSENSRAFSHGCIRLAEPERLAAYLFRADSINMPPDTIHALMNRHIERRYPSDHHCLCTSPTSPHG
jgi:murein L,D-transpeptidase YcbB/YkuD